MNTNTIINSIVAFLVFLIAFPIVLAQLGVINIDANLEYVTGGAAIFGLAAFLMVIGMALMVFKKFGGGSSGA